MFKSWHQLFGPNVEVSAIQLPGRGQRIAEPPIADIKLLVPALASALVPTLDRPFAFFGHSLGAILSYEVSKRLRTHHGVLPAHLFVAGRRAPHMANTEPTAYDKNDEEFIQHLIDLKGTPEAILEDRELLYSVLPALRADFELGETYLETHSPPLPCPITVFGGEEDDESLDNRLDEWRTRTTCEFRKHLFPGDHFFIHSNERELVKLIDVSLQALIAASVR